MKNLKNYLIESKLRCTKYRKRLLDISQKVSALSYWRFIFFM